jgi:hypothetical protein
VTLVEFTQVLTPIGVLVTAIGVIVNAWVSWDNKRILRRQDLVIAHVDDQVQKIELATNSMKDALVLATAKASEAEGHAAGLQQGRAEGKP